MPVLVFSFVGRYLLLTKKCGRALFLRVVWRWEQAMKLVLVRVSLG